jgi:hypothetical protein
MPKPNYQHVKKQKEQARKARQAEKRQRKLARGDTAVAAADADPKPIT